MRFNVVFDTDNAAFEGDDFPVEVGRILYGVANVVIEEGRLSGPIFDINGNRVGYFGEV